MMPHELKVVEKELNEISPSFCVAKWKQVTIHLETGTTHSCHHVSPHKIPLSELSTNSSALHNTSFKKEQRKKMLEGVRPAECDYCWRVEDSPNETFSDRHTKSSRFWANPYIGDIVSNPWDHDVFPSYLEVSFSNACTYKCSYCSPSFSSKWAEEIKQHGPYPTGHYDLNHLKQNNQLPIPVREHNPYLEAFWKWWPDLYPNLKVFRITGGEPLISKETFRILDYFIDNPHPDLSFAVNTNLGVPDEQFDEFIEKMKIISANKSVKNVEIYTSIEGWGERAAYIRHGMDFDKFMGSVERVLSELPECDLIFMSAFNALSVTSFKQLLEKVHELKIKYGSDIRPNGVLVDIPYLRYPEHQAIDILPSEYLVYIDEMLKYMRDNEETEFSGINNGFQSFEINHIERIYDLMLESKDNEKSLARKRANFYKFFNEHDKRRNTDFLRTFPEMKDFWELAKKEATS